MKKLIAVALLSLSVSGFAQEKKKGLNEERTAFTAQQQTELQVKKLTLELDLSSKQQKEMTEIAANQEAKKQAMKAEMQLKKEENRKATADEKFAMRSKMLDEKIAYRTELKKILSAEQLLKWDDISKKNERMQDKGMRRNQRNQK